MVHFLWLLMKHLLDGAFLMMADKIFVAWCLSYDLLHYAFLMWLINHLLHGAFLLTVADKIFIACALLLMVAYKIFVALIIGAFLQVPVKLFVA